MKVEVVSEDVGAKENGAKTQLLENILLHIQKLKCKKGTYELKGHVGEEALHSNLPPKLGPAKRIPPISFSNYLLEST